MMEFSIIIPTYRRTEKLKIAIKSAINQSYLKEYEIIIVDDSGENTKEHLKNYELIKEVNSSKIRYVVQKESFGANAARNRGINEAKGEYLVFLDDDDEMLPNKLEKLEEVLKKEKIDLIYSNYYIKYQNEEEIFYHENSKVEDVKKEILKRNFIGSTSFVTIKKTVLDELQGFNENLTSCQDWELWIRIIWSKKRIFLLEDKLVVYYVDKYERTRISNDINKKLKGHLYIYKYIKNNYLNYYSKQEKEEIIFFQKATIAHLNYKNSNFKEYRKFFIKNYNFKRYSLEDYLKFFLSIFHFKINSNFLIKFFLLKKTNDNIILRKKNEKI